MAEKQMVSLWLLAVLSIDVCQYAVYELCGTAGTAAIGLYHAFMDCADSMVCKVRCTGLDTAVCIRLLQSDADKHDAGHPHHAGV